jgi:hypothetical protein
MHILSSFCMIFSFSLIWYVETVSQVMQKCMSSEWYYRAMTSRLCIMHRYIDSNSIQASFATIQQYT